jgi:radical SAM-linked protein
MDPVQRILFRFRKEGPARFWSHRDLMRLFERALRRAAFPLRMTEGYNPHPRFSITLALPLGVAADEEVIEVQLREPVSLVEARQRLAAQMPQGLEICSAEALPPGKTARVNSVVYETELPPDVPCTSEAVAAFLARESIPVERTSRKGRRSLDIRPALTDLKLKGRRLRMQLRVDPQGTPRPTEVLEALLGAEAAERSSPRLRRTRVNLAGPPRDRSTAACPTERHGK